MNLTLPTLITVVLMLGGCRVMPQEIEDDALPNQNGRYFTIVIQNQIRAAMHRKGNDALTETVEYVKDPKGLLEQGWAKCIMPAIKRYSPNERFLHPKWLYERLPELKPETRSISDLEQFEQEKSRVEVAKALGLRYIISLSIRNEFNSSTFGEWVGGGPMPPVGLTAIQGERVTIINATVHDFQHPDNPQIIDTEVRRPHTAALIIIIPYIHIPNTESEACEKLGESVGKYLNSLDSENLLLLAPPHSIK